MHFDDRIHNSDFIVMISLSIAASILNIVSYHIKSTMLRNLTNSLNSWPTYFEHLKQISNSLFQNKNRGKGGNDRSCFAGRISKFSIRHLNGHYKLAAPRGCPAARLPVCPVGLSY